MSQHRRGRRVLEIAVGVVLMVATTGCRHAPFHRFGDEKPIGPDGKPVGYQEPLSTLDQASAVPALKPTAPAPAPVSVAAPAPAPAAVEAVGARPSPRPVVADAISPPPPPAEPLSTHVETPMLDAALQRALALEAEQRREMRAEVESQAEAEAEAPAVALAPAPEPSSSKPKEKAAPPRDDAVQRAAAEAPAVPSEEDRAKLWSACADLVDRLPPDLSAAAVPALLPRAVAMLAPASPPKEPAPETAEAPPPLRIDVVQLCRSIRGFGAFEPMDLRALKAGRPVGIYCELSGLTYRREGEDFVARIATRIELIDARDGSKAWEILGDSEDRCHSLRRDSYVSTRVVLPASLTPGDYTIRLSQTDLLTQQASTAELAVTIGR